MSELSEEEGKISASYDAKTSKYDEQIASIDKKYEQKMAPYSIDPINDEMNQSIAELENKKIETTNKLQELLDAISSARDNEMQS